MLLTGQIFGDQIGDTFDREHGVGEWEFLGQPLDQLLSNLSWLLSWLAVKRTDRKLASNPVIAHGTAVGDHDFPGSACRIVHLPRHRLALVLGLRTELIANRLPYFECATAADAGLFGY